MVKYLVSSLVLAGFALAQTSTVCNGPSITIASDADASQIATCGIYNGDVIIDSSASGTINLSGVQQISGNLQCRNATGLNAINANSLTTIGKTFDLESLITLATLNMPYLKRVANVNWVALPALQSLNFQTGIQQASSVVISNTQLNDLDGIELTSVGSIDVNNNPYLNTINVNNLKNITQALSFSANGMNLNVQFPSLQYAGNLTFRNVSSVDMPSLSSVGGSIGMYSDYFQNFSAPNLSTVAAALAFIDCPQLTTFSFPSLTLVGGGFIVVNNTNLKSISGFDKLVTIGGAIDFIGTFDTVEAKSLKDVRGGANVVTSSQNQNICSIFQSASKNQVIKGNTMCSTNTVTAQTNGTSGSSNGTKSAANILSISPAITFTSFFSFAAYMLL
ncbi:hypothetical protein R6Q59_010071 [Mikania micrantha]